MTTKEHLLVTLMEEANELSFAISKALRFGLHTDNHRPEDNGHVTNEMQIFLEFHQLCAVLDMLVSDGHLRDFDLETCNGIRKDKKKKVQKYLEVSKENGCTKDECEPTMTESLYTAIDKFQQWCEHVDNLGADDLARMLKAAKESLHPSAKFNNPGPTSDEDIRTLAEMDDNSVKEALGVTYTPIAGGAGRTVSDERGTVFIPGGLTPNTKPIKIGNGSTKILHETKV